MPSDATVSTFQEGIMEWSADNLREFSWRQTSEPYEVLIAEILLQRTAAEKVEPIYDEFLKRYPSPSVLSKADVSEVADGLKPLGLHNKRSTAPVRIGDLLSERAVPQSKGELLELPFVGRYAANATLCFAYNRRRPIVDRNVVRVYERAFGVDLDYRDDESWAFGERLLPDTDYRRYNLAVLDFAAEICTARSPSCTRCFFKQDCAFFRRSE